MTISTPEGKRTLDQVRSLAFDLPEITERLSHSTPTFFIRDKKVLAHLWEDHHGDDRLALWCPAPAGVQSELVDREPDRFFVPPYVGPRGWLGIRLDIDPDWDEVAEILEDAYRMVAPKTLIKLLDQG